MQELLNQIIEQIRGSWRFRRYALIVAWAVAIIGWGVIFSLQDVYQANSRVFVDTKTALNPVLQGLTLDQDVNAQLNLVRQSLLAGPQLEPVAQDVGLIDVRTMSVQERTQVVDAMRSRITLSVSAAGKDLEAGSIYSIQYRDTARDRSLKVVEILQTRLIENTLGGKRLGSEEAQKFLLGQIAEYERRLRMAEERLAGFKKTNVGLMPSEQGGYFSGLQTAMDAVKTAQASLSIALSRRDELQRQLRGEAPIAAATTGPAGPGTLGGGDTLTRIKEAQARLDELLLRFTDKHPDVIGARENLEQLKLRREREIEALRRGDPNAAAASGASASPVYQSIQLQLNQVEVEVASLRRELADQQAKVAELRKMLDTVPQVEAEYARLNRDYDVTRANYTALVERLEKSRLGEEASSGSVRFNLIDPPFAAFGPAAPKRSLLILGVLAVAFAAGAGAAFLLHQLMPVYTSVRNLAESTGLQVLGAISMVSIGTRRPGRRTTYLRYGGAAAALIVVAAVVLQLSRMGVRIGSPGA